MGFSLCHPSWNHTGQLLRLQHLPHLGLLGTVRLTPIQSVVLLCNQPAMPRRIHIESDDVLGVASTAMEITESITDLVHVPIASTVASLVSVVLKAAKVGPSCHFKWMVY